MQFKSTHACAVHHRLFKTGTCSAAQSSFFTTLAAEAAEDALVEILGETLQAAEEQTHLGAAQTAV